MSTIARGRQRSYSRFNDPRAFTLVELLIVVGIIALMVAITVPAIGHAKRLAQQTVCASNLRQLGAALTAYLASHNRTLPDQKVLAVEDYANPNSPPSFLRAMYKYLSDKTEALVCPTALNTFTNYSGVMGISNQRSDTNYMGNGAVLGTRLSRIENSGQIIWIQELSIRGNSSQLRPFPHPSNPAILVYWHEAFYDPIQNAVGENLTTLHGNGSGRGAIGGNVLYLDGRAEFRGVNTLRSPEFGLKPDEPRTVNNSVQPETGGFFTRRW